MTTRTLATPGVKPGSYAVGTTRSWMTVNESAIQIGNAIMNQIPQYAIPGKKSKAQHVIVNPIFMECVKYIEDEHWRNIFIKAAGGKFPKGFTYKDNKLIYRIRTKVIQQEIPQDVFNAIQTNKKK